MDKIYSRPRLVIPKFKISIFNQLFGRNNLNNNYGKNRVIIIKMLRIFIILLIAFISMFKILDAIDEIVDKQCSAQAKSIATRVSNEQATAVMAKYKYDDLFNVEKDSSGNISMISANPITVNEIVSDISIRIQKELDKEANNSFNLRLGSITGTKLFAGRGPNINIKIETTGSIDTDLKSEFEERGINQTLHKMYLQVECNVTILTPYKTIEEKITNQILLSEAVIMGTTPETYLTHLTH